MTGMGTQEPDDMGRETSSNEISGDREGTMR